MPKSDFPITIFHNPACGTSRNTVAMVKAAGYEPEVVEYLQAGWTKPQLKGLLEAMGAGPREILREKGTPAAELGLLDASVGDEAIVDAMVEHPILVNPTHRRHAQGCEADRTVRSCAGPAGSQAGELHQRRRRGCADPLGLQSREAAWQC
jgi:arsenate reductase (glutaredoxin)